MTTQAQPSPPSLIGRFMPSVFKAGIAILSLAALTVLIGQTVEIELDIGHIKTGVHYKGNVFLNMHQPAEPVDASQVQK